MSLPAGLAGRPISLTTAAGNDSTLCGNRDLSSAEHDRVTSARWHRGCIGMHESSSIYAMTIFVHVILIASLLVGCCSAQTSALKVLPWNNHAAALVADL